METNIRVGVYDEAGRYLGPADVVIRFWVMDPRDSKALQAPLVVLAPRRAA